MRLTDHASFSGNAADLASLAVDCAQGMRLPVDASKTNERLVRYYVTAGVLDRPDRVGRDAAYGYRHLLQMLTLVEEAEKGPLQHITEQHRQHHADAEDRRADDRAKHVGVTHMELGVTKLREGENTDAADDVVVVDPSTQGRHLSCEVLTGKLPFVGEIQEIFNRALAETVHRRLAMENLEAGLAEIARRSA